MITDDIAQLSALHSAAELRCKTVRSAVTLENCGKFRSVVVSFTRAMEAATPFERLVRLALIIKRQPLQSMLAAFRTPQVRGDGADPSAIRAQLQAETNVYRRDVRAIYCRLLQTIENVYKDDIEAEQQLLAAKAANVTASSIMSFIHEEHVQAEAVDLNQDAEDPLVEVVVKPDPATAALYS